MIIWSGRGWLTICIVFGVLFAFNFALDAKFGSNYYSTHNWAIGLGLVVSGACTWLAAFKMKDPGRTLVDPATGQTVLLRRKDTLFFIPMEYIAILISLGGLVLCFIKDK